MSNIIQYIFICIKEGFSEDWTGQIIFPFGLSNFLSFPGNYAIFPKFPQVLQVFPEFVKKNGLSPGFPGLPA